MTIRLGRHSKLQNQVVLITGCSTGIGRALARRFAREGHQTFATARKRESLHELQAEGISTLQLDVLDPTSVSAALAAAHERAGRIDVVVNNAGVLVGGPLAELPIDEFERVLATNVTGALSVVQAAFPFMAQQGSGRIVNVGSVVGVMPTPFAGAYCASKSSLHMLSDVLRVELAPFGIDVVVVQPAAIRSSLADNGNHGLERYAREDSRYRQFYEAIVRRVRLSQEQPMDTDAFACALVDRVMAIRAPREVRLGPGAERIVALRMLPGGWLDRLLARKFGVTAQG